MSFLDRVAAEKRLEVEALRRRPPGPAPAGPRRSLREALAGPGPGLIAELKRRSPSRGALRADADAAAIARAYAWAGARALSVLTDGPHFGGHLDDLRAARAAVDLPLLRKDFLLDPLQVLEARAAGADAVLLIVAMLSQDQLTELLAAAGEAGLEALVETHDEAEIARALEAGADLVGVNCRDLRTLAIDLAVAERLLPLIPAPALRVAESGIHTPEDLARVARAGAHAALVGSALMSAPDPGAALAALLGR